MCRLDVLIVACRVVGLIFLAWSSVPAANGLSAAEASAMADFCNACAAQRPISWDCNGTAACSWGCVTCSGAGAPIFSMFAHLTARLSCLSECFNVDLLMACSADIFLLRWGTSAD